MPKKYIVVTGGVISGIGKGVLAASTGRLLKEAGLDIRSVKMDPYLNVDAGTMNPNQHGEVYVTEDGYEADLDLGHYERFMGINVKKENNITAGQIYSSVIDKERAGKYLGSTVQMVPHVTAEIKSRLSAIASEILIIEIGGTVGDIEGEIFLEAIRELYMDIGRENFLFIHTTYVPFLRTTNEFKTKPTQQSVQLLRRIGIQPDIIAARSELPISSNERRKIALFAGVNPEMVVNLPDIKNVYEMPQNLFNLKFHHLIAQRFNMTINDAFEWDVPKTFLPLKIGIIGKYLGTDDAYKSINESIFLSGAEKPEVLDSQEIEELEDDEVEEMLKHYDALIIPGGFGKRGVEGKIKAIRYARENGVPVLGICLGMQLMVVEYARSVGQLEGANSTEFDPDTPNPVIDMMAHQKEVLNLGGTMRLGGQKTPVFADTRLSQVYEGQTQVMERHRHRYEVNHEICRDFLKNPGEDRNALTISSKEDFVEAVEIYNHPFFIGIQYHPEYGSKVGAPHPLFKALIESARKG